MVFTILLNFSIATIIHNSVVQCLQGEEKNDLYRSGLVIDLFLASILEKLHLFEEVGA